MMRLIRYLYLLSLVSLLLTAPHAVHAQANATSTPVTAYQLPEEKDIQAKDPRLKIQDLVKALPSQAKRQDPFLILVNKNNSYQEWMEPELAWDGYGNVYAQALVEPLQDLLEAGAEAGFYYRIVSGYRSVAEQEANRQASIQNYLAEGLSQEQAEAVTNQYYAPADASEHTTGLAIDLLGVEWLDNGGELTASYAATASAQWLADHAHESGFILRYQDKKEAITGYNFEPWHYRYVGVEHARYMHDYGLTLEEYLKLLSIRDGR